jgi:ABC-type taurine transport system substrate-binding protein
MNKSKILVISCVWLGAVGFICIAAKYILMPHREAVQKETEKKQQAEKVAKTSSTSHYKINVDFGLDSFTAYSILRSSEFKNELSAKRINLTQADDGADYATRLAKLKSGELQMAAFTIDALIKASSDPAMSDLPAVIVSILDETRGADGLVAYKQAVPNIDALNDPDMKFVLTKDSPSETLARVLISHFGLTNVNQNNFIYVKDAEEVYKTYRNSKPEQKQVYVLWEPYISKMIENPNCQVLIDSSKFRGYIVDVVVASRDFIVKNPEVVKEFLESYFRTTYKFSQKEKGFLEVCTEDARSNGVPLSPIQADRLVKGIWFKNTQENYSHFGLNNDKPLQHIQDMILNITKVLQNTNAIAKDPTNSSPQALCYDKALMELSSSNFHPGLENVRKDNEDLPTLSESQWNSLIAVGTLDVPQIVFARGSSTITDQGTATLDELMQKLKSWRSYYISIRGDASLKGDVQANKELALQRAKAVEAYLLEKGLGRTRVKAVAAEPTGTSAVVFQLGYTPY